MDYGFKSLVSSIYLLLKISKIKIRFIMKKLQFIDTTPDEIINAINQNSNKNFLEVAKLFEKIRQQETYLSRQDVATLLKVNISTIHNYCKKGILKPLQIGGKVLFKRQDVDDSIERINT